jgi:hypothetical protein
MPIDLSLVSDRELIDELANRNAATVVLMLKVRNDECYTDFIFRGGRYACQGLTAQFAHDMANEPGEPHGEIEL